MDEAPQPSTLSEILDRTIQIYRRRFLVFAGVAAAPYAAVLIPVCIFLLPLGGWSEGFSSGKLPDLFSIILVVLGALLAAPVWVGVTALATGALTHAASHCYFGDGISIRGAFKEAWTRRWSYSGLYLLEILLIWVAPVVVWFVLVSAGAAMAAVAQSSGVGPAGGMLLGTTAVLLVAGLMAYGLWMLLRLALAFPACVVERISLSDALRRGPALSRGTRGRVFLLYLLGGVISYLLSIAILLPVTIAVALIPELKGPEHAQAAAMVMFAAAYGIAIAAQALTKPVYAIAMLLFYFDQRIRHEGFDIEWMMMRAGLVAPAAPQAGAQPWMAGAATAMESMMPGPGTAESAAARGEIL
jgi:hypothetical protein